MLRFPDQTFLSPGQALLIAKDAQEFYVRFGFDPDFEMVDSGSPVPELLQKLTGGVGPCPALQRRG